MATSMNRFCGKCQTAWAFGRSFTNERRRHHGAPAHRQSRLTKLLICVLLVGIGQLLGAQETETPDSGPLGERDRLRHQASVAIAGGHFEEAQALLERALELEQRIGGQAQGESFETLEQLCQLAAAKKDYGAVIRYRDQQHQWLQQLHGAGDYRTQDANRLLADARQRANFSREQEAALLQAEACAAEMVQFYQDGNFTDALRSAKNTLEQIRQVLGDQHADYAIGLNNLAFMHASLGQYSSAESLYREAIEKQEKILGRVHPDFALSLNNLATIYENVGDYFRAEPIYQETLSIREKTVGKLHPDYAVSLNNLSSLYTTLGDYPKAEPLLQECRLILQQTLGTQDPFYGGAVMNLGSIYDFMGDYVQAETLYLEASNILLNALGEEHPTYATSLMNLAQLYTTMRNLPKAELYYQEAQEIQAKTIGQQHPDYALTLHNLALLYHRMQNYDRAQQFFREALALESQVLGSQHPLVASTLNGMAVLFAELGDDEQAESLYREALAIRENSLGKRHPFYTLCLNNLATLHEARGDFPQAESLYREAVETTLGNLELTAEIQSQRQQVAMGESLRYLLDTYLSLAIRQAQYQQNAYATVLQWKGIVWQRQQRQRLLVDRPELNPRFSELNQVSSQLSALILSPPSPDQRDEWYRQLVGLTSRREQLERDLSLASIEYRQASSPVTIEQLRLALPPGSSLIDFLEFDHFVPANQERKTAKSVERSLLVYLIKPDHEVKAIHLGPVEPLNKLVDAWRADYGQNQASAEAAQKLRQMIWEPISESLTGVTTVFVSPDGLLGQFPLGALPGQTAGTFLLEELAIVMLPVPQGLPAMSLAADESTTFSVDSFFLVGGVDYEDVTPGSILPSATTHLGISPETLATRGSARQQYPNLPGTVTEIEMIVALLQQSQPATQTMILRDKAAGEPAFARFAPQHRYLHVATHGFFAPESVRNALNPVSPSFEPGSAVDLTSPPRIIGFHPDLLSGLVLAGANRAATSSHEDGILTAAEVQALDLRAVELAVLSACETGLGKTAGGEGIIGLQRAFQLAGAKTTITSLWHVDDAATQALMVEFYRNRFERKLSKLESLRQAQIWLLNHPDAISDKNLRTRGEPRPVRPLVADINQPARSLPYYWAAFQLSGDPR